MYEYIVCKNTHYNLAITFNENVPGFPILFVDSWVWYEGVNLPNAGHNIC